MSSKCRLRHKSHARATPRIRKALRMAGPFRVYSQAGGTFTIVPDWTAWNERGHRLSPEKYCLECDCYHIGGVLDRLSLAEILEDLLNDVAGIPGQNRGGRAPGEKGR